MVHHRWQERDTDNENEFTLSLCQWLSLASLSDRYIIDTFWSVFVCVGLRLNVFSVFSVSPWLIAYVKTPDLYTLLYFFTEIPPNTTPNPNHPL